MKPSEILFEKISDNKVRCLACPRYCEMKDDQIGLCGVRGNKNGMLELFVYGLANVGHIDPIEKKPVTHYRPGTKVFSIGTTGCNWMCKYCQNYDLSQRRKIEGKKISPEMIVDEALAHGSQGIAYTYNEPIIFLEYAHDCGKIAHEKGLFNIFVSNGYGTPESVNMMGDFLDCITVDFKGSAEPNFVKKFIGVPDPSPIFDTLLEIRDKTKIHVEITDLIIPRDGEDLEYAKTLCKFIFDEFGPEMPIHFLRFHPDYKMQNYPSTPIETLQKHYDIAKEVGLEYVYLGNTPGHPLENTYCSGCKKMVVKRHGFDILGWYLDKNNCCNFCGNKIPITGKLDDSFDKTRFEPIF